MIFFFKEILVDFINCLNYLFYFTCFISQLSCYKFTNKEWAGPCCSSVSNVWWTSILPSIVAAPVYIPPTVYLGPLPSTSSPALLTVVSLVIAILAGVRWYLSMVLIYIYQMISNVDHLFIATGHLCLFVGKYAYSGLLPIFNWIVCFSVLTGMRCLYILDVNPFSDVSFSNIFSHSVGCPSFCWWLPSLCKPFNFNYVPFMYFCFVSFALGMHAKSLQPCLTLWTGSHQAPLSMGFSR